MVKHTQTIRRQIADELFECVSPFCGLALKELNMFQHTFSDTIKIRKREGTKAFMQLTHTKKGVTLS